MNKAITAGIAGSVFGAGIVLLAINIGGAPTASHTPAELIERPVIAVSSESISITEIPRHHVAAGQVSADQTIELSSRISGYISRLLPAEGATVNAGELLVEIDAAPVESEIRQAKASLQQARSELSDARADVERFNELAKTNAISREDLRKAKLRQSRATAAVENALARLAEHRAELAYTQIKSPVRARIIEHLSKAGDLAIPGAAILRLESISNPHFETWVPISIIDKLAFGNSVSLKLEGQTGSIQSIITELVRSADTETRRCKVRLGLPEDIKTLVGHYGNAQFLLGHDRHPMVAESALTQRAGIDGVFIIDEKGFARFRSVRSGRHWNNQVELLAGPADGQLVILSPSIHLRDGDEVTTKPST